MYIQGDLQKVFDALFHLGAIDPVLKLDWIKEQKQMHKHYSEIQKIVTMANDFKGDAKACLLYTSPSPRDQRGSRMPSSA